MLADPDRNVMFSVHTYWAVSDGADQAFIAYQFQMAMTAGLPLIVGEFTHMFNRGQTCTYEIDYASIIQECQARDMGWLAWEWGPGNEYNEPTCEIMNMTTNSYYSTLRDTWAKVVAVTSPYSIQATSVTPTYIVNAGVCDPSDVHDDRIVFDHGIAVYPNPAFGSVHVTVTATIDQLSDVHVDVYDATGQHIRNVYSGVLTAGQHNFTLAPGHLGINWIVVKAAHGNDAVTVHSTPLVVAP
jgi:hypothetical protein